MYIAKVVFWGANEGGRHVRPVSGFQPQIAVGDIHTSCVVENLGSEGTFDFGKEYNVSLRLLFPNEYGNMLLIGSPVHLYEGSKHIGQGEIVSIQ